MKKITYLVAVLLASCSLLYSAAEKKDTVFQLPEAISTKAIQPIERRFDTPDLAGSEFFPTAYKNQNINISTIHSQAHLWPEQYRKAMFKHGLLNNYIDKYSGFPAIIQRKEDLFRKKLFSSKIFHRRTTKDPEIAEGRFKMSCALYLAFQEGLHQNEQLLAIGANYLKHKVREEALSAEKRKGRFLDVSNFEKQERGRGDLLQDLAWTIVWEASEIMSSIQKVIEGDEEFQALVTEKELFESQNSEYLNDEDFMAECGAPYTQCLERFEKYVQATREFFAMYTPTISGFDPSEFQALELIDLGVEDISTVPRNLRTVVDSETH